MTHKTANNNIFPGVQAFLPSQTGWVFDWIKLKAVPQLLCNNALRKTSLELTDEDRQYIHVSGNVHGNTSDNPHGNAKIHLYKWHKVSTNCYYYYVNLWHYKLIIIVQLIKNVTGKQRISTFLEEVLQQLWCYLFVDSMANFMYHIIDDVESLEEENYLMSVLEDWLVKEKENTMNATGQSSSYYDAINIPDIDA